MPRRLLHRIALAGLVPALLLGAVPCVLVAPSSAVAQDGQDLDLLYEDLKVAMTRLKYSLEKVQNIAFALGGDDASQRRDIIRRCKASLEEARALRVSDAEQVRASIDTMGALRDEANDFLKGVQPLWGEGAQAYGKKEHLDSPYVEVLKFRDAAASATEVSEGLSEDENQHVRALVQEGEDTIALLKETKEKDHVATEEHLRKLGSLRQELDQLFQRGMSARGKGFPFVKLQRSGQQQWTDVSHAENGFSALRTRFIEPQSAYVTVRNDSEDLRPLFVELSFYDAVGGETGSGVLETQRLEEMRPGEVREILVPILPTHPQFWEVTRGYTVHLN